MEFKPTFSVVEVMLKCEALRDKEYRKLIGRFPDGRDALRVAMMYAENLPLEPKADDVDMPNCFILLVEPGKEDLGKDNPEEFEELEEVRNGVYSF